MHILFVSNYYPPCRYAWGYQQLCEEVANGLFAKGHAVTVLTSAYGNGYEMVHPYPIHRILPIEPDWHSGRSAARQFFVGRRKRERRALASFQEIVEACRPDVLFFWHTGGVHRSLLVKAEQSPGVLVAYYLADYLPEFQDEYTAHWQKRPAHGAATVLKRLLSALALYLLAREDHHASPKYENCICVSDYVRRRLVTQGLIPPSTAVIRNGIDLDLFCPDKRMSSLSRPSGLRCLIAGRISPEKGIHTVVDALGLLGAKGALNGIVLTVLGSGPADYFARLQAQVALHHLEEIVEFREPIPRERMPELLAHYDVLILASEHAEPLARAIQEAMAMGLLVVGTNTGGSGELLVHEKTGLVFEPGSPESLATQIVRVLDDRDLVSQLIEEGRKAVMQHFDIRRTIEQIEHLLLDLLQSRDT